MKTYMKRYIMAALLLAAGIGGTQAREYYVGTNQTESQANNRYTSLENLVSKATNWQTNNTIYITSNLSVKEQIVINHNCTIQPSGGSWTISADKNNFKNSHHTVFIVDNKTTVELTKNSNYTITIEGFGWNLGTKDCYIDITPDNQKDWLSEVKYARCVTVKDNATFNFEGGTLKHGYQEAGGGIYVEPKGTVVMSGNAIITECSARQGGGVYNKGTFTLDGSAQIIKNSAWVDNRKKLDANEGKCCEDPNNGFVNLDLALGGGICNERETVSDVAKLYIKGGSITENSIDDPLGIRQYEYHDKMKDKDGHAYPNLSPAGAGISIYGGEATMTGGTITKNVVNLRESSDKEDDHANGGGGVQVTSVRNKTKKDADYADWMTGTFTMSAGTISNNGARRGGGLILGGQSKTTITGGTITENWALQQGGGIFLNKQYALLDATNALFTKNECKNGGGGAIYVNESDPRTIVKESTFKDNKCKYSGGAIILDHSGSTDNAYMHLQNVVFDGNYSDKIGTDDTQNTSSNNGNAISNKGKLYISGDITLINTNGYNQDWCLRSCTSSKHEQHVIFKEGTVRILDGNGKTTKLGIHIISPSDRRNVFVSTANSDVIADDLNLFIVKTNDWVGTEYFNGSEVTKGLGDIDNNYQDDHKYSGYDEKTSSSSGTVGTKAQPTHVIELHKLGQITITNASLSHGESAVYTVKPKADAVGNALRSEYKVVLQGTDDKDPATVSRTIIDVEPGDYYVIEETWNWAYENADKKKDPAWVSAGETTTFSFTGTRQSPAKKQVMYDEDIKENLFKQTR